MNLLLLLGVAILLGFAGGRLFEKIRIPQVVGYIVVGVVLGDSLAGLLGSHLLTTLAPVTQLALGFIGFMVGGELKAAVFKKYGTQLITILLFEGIMATLVVGVAVTVLTGKLYLGILLGALASATAPAATVDVLWEYRSKGPLTSTVFAIVALDDGLALILYGFAIAFAAMLLGGEAFSLRLVLVGPLKEIFGSILLGGGIGWVVSYILRFIPTADEILAFLVALILAVSGLASYLGLSLILTDMALGMALANLLSERDQRGFDIVKGFTPPIYILFFVFVGARLQLGLLPKMGLLGLVYVAGRTAGKMTGAGLGAMISHAPETVRKYLGWALFSQAGVAVGLALDIYDRLGVYGTPGLDAGHKIINVITATTFIVQVIGPPSVKYAISKAGEIPEGVKGGE
ncbi:MAG: cation:proton antiporter [Deltaproteobacteria bacterium]|nr:cation:proton antiporter [Deltaproteobacteria bacterium]